MTSKIIALDMMGGDHGLAVTVPAVKIALDADPDLHLVLVGNAAEINARLSKDIDFARIKVEDAQEVVQMDDLPSVALRSKKRSSMRIALDLVKDGQAQACVSAGNTGALMAIARYVLRTVPGIDRPAIIRAIPTFNGHSYVLDLGANVDCSAEQLVQFAHMGFVLSKAVDGIENPRIGLLNIGAEEIKGNEAVKSAGEILSADPHLNYVGFVEGDDIYEGTADVIVCDGFVGNVALKSSEGVAKLIVRIIKQEYLRSWYSKLMATLAYPILSAVRKRLDPGNYNGACLIGLRGIVIKSHGGADQHALAHAIREAAVQVCRDVPNLLEKELKFYEA